MKRVLIIVFAVTLMSAGTATAQVPSAAWQKVTQNAALDYWNHAPLFVGSSIDFRYEPMDPSLGGEANWLADPLQLSINSDEHWSLHDLCIVTVHEVGHAVLGPFAFQSTSPLDPAHSEDPSNVMHKATTMYALPIKQCEFKPVIRSTTIHLQTVHKNWKLHKRHHLARVS